jgi:hypothetical protein
MVRGQLEEKRIVIILIVCGIAVLSWWLVGYLTDNAAIDQTFIANQLKYGTYAVLTSPFDQNLTLDFQEQKNYSIVARYENDGYTLGVIGEDLVSFSYATKLNIPEKISLIGTVENFTRVCLHRSDKVVEMKKC